MQPKYALLKAVFSLESKQNVPIIEDGDQYSTDLMKCIFELQEKERREGQEASGQQILPFF